jgi:acyl-coenzyme A synthetase/AMP-(fatty) acid ligase
VFSPLKYSHRNKLGYYEDAATKERLDFVDVKEKAACLSTALVRRYRFRARDTVSLFSSNNIWYPVALWATVRVGTSEQSYSFQ